MLNESLCRSELCSGHGSCINLTPVNRNATVIQCNCDAFWEGSRCTRRNCGEGDLSLCQHGGTCIRYSGDEMNIACACPASFYGPYCELSIANMSNSALVNDSNQYKDPDYEEPDENDKKDEIDDDVKSTPTSTTIGKAKRVRIRKNTQNPFVNTSQSSTVGAIFTTSLEAIISQPGRKEWR